MPAGKVLRIDPGRKSVHIERRGRAQEAPLVGPDDLAMDVTTQPFRLVGVWLNSMTERDVEGALTLYRSDAVIHLPDGDVTGRARMGQALAGAGWPGVGANGARVRGLDRFVLAEPVNGSAIQPTAFLVERGEITEQWIGVEPAEVAAARAPEAAEPQITVARRGSISDAAVTYAEEKVKHLVVAMGRPLVWGQIKLTHTSNPANEQPSMAEVSLDFDRTMIRAHATARTMPEAIDSVTDRLRAKLEKLSDRERHKPIGVSPAPGQWRHGNLPPARAPYTELEPDEAEVVRHKSFAPDRLGLDEALWDLALLDYDFFLFVEQTTGVTCVAERTGGDEVIIHGLADRPDDQAALARPEVSFSPRSVPVLRTSEAIALLEASGERFELFENAQSGTEGGEGLQRNVIYRRLDGHYGLITPPRSEGTP